MKKIKQLAIITVIFALVLPTAILADIPESFSVRGNITIDGEDAPVGVIISVEKDNQNIANTIVTFEGKYLVAISAENIGETLAYKIDGFSSISEDANPEGNPSSQTIDLAFATVQDNDDDEDQQEQNNNSSSSSSSGTDRTPPSNTSILINNNDQTTNSAEVVLSLLASGASKMMIANDSDFTGAEWENYATTKNWVLTEEDEEKTVYAKFKDTSGNTSSPVQDLIILSTDTNQAGILAIPAIPQVVVLGVQSDYRTIQVNKILSEAGYIFGGDADSVAQNRKKQRNEGEETEIHNRYVVRLTKGINGLTESNIRAFTNFILYSTETTDILGAGERAGVINSYKSAYGKLPTTEAEWNDLILIANGRWPSEKRETAETNGKKEFKKVYKRDANMENANDNAAVTIIAYGLRSDSRNLDSEKAGIKSFKHIYKYNPTSAIDWDIVRAIAYSGAVR
ncbi:hypothetical protein KAJ61_02915 [Candidatus Parcubacteria bacterium]|nr:hypothetical protein [Candidatus Parcubacteria bacterium]